MKQLTILTAIALLVLTSCEEKKKTQKTTDASKSGPLSVDVKIVSRDTVAESIEVAGNVLPYELTEIRPEISGRVISLNFKEGSTVQKNTLLVKLFDGDLQAQLKKLLVQQQIADKTEERQRELLKINGISQQDYDLSLLQLNNIKADIELIKVNISKTEIKAPYTGRIGLRNISIGAFVTPSNIITSISQVDQKKISFSIPERYSNQVKTGQKIDFGIEGKDQNYTASVLASESVIEAQTRNLKIVATINDSKNELVPGTFAKVSLTLGENTNAVSIPSQCVIPSARSKQVILYKNGEPQFVNVKTGIRGADNVQITEGVLPGDTVIVTGLLFIRKDSKLKLGKIQ
ncbi:MAG: efflux RND transporter periplasmic adaptor subunit [Chitinophagaceae bacterium]